MNETQKQEIIKLVNDKMKELNKETVLIFLSGSRLNGIQKKDSDFDLYVLVKPTIDEFLSNTHFGKELEFGFINDGNNKVEVNGKCLSLIHFFTILRKTNFNTIELLLNEPLFCSEKSFVKLIDENISLLCTFDLKRMIDSVKGYAFKNIKKNEKYDGIYKQAFKDTQQVVKGVNYIKQVIQNGKIVNVDFKNTFVDKVKNNEEFKKSLTKEELININKKVVEFCEEVKNEELVNEDKKVEFNKFEEKYFNELIKLLNLEL